MSATVTAIQVGAKPSLTLKEQFENICHVVVREEYNERQQKRIYPHKFATPFLIVIPLLLLALFFRTNYSLFNVFVTSVVIYLWIRTANEFLKNNFDYYVYSFEDIRWVDRRVKYLYRHYGTSFYDYYPSIEEKFERHPHVNEIIRSLQGSNYSQDSSDYSIHVGLRNEYEKSISENNRRMNEKADSLVTFFST